MHIALFFLQSNALTHSCQRHLQRRIIVEGLPMASRLLPLQGDGSRGSTYVELSGRRGSESSLGNIY